MSLSSCSMVTASFASTGSNPRHRGRVSDCGLLRELFEPLLYLAHAAQPAVGLSGPTCVHARDLRMREDQEPAVGDALHHRVDDRFRLDRPPAEQRLGPWGGT